MRGNDLSQIFREYIYNNELSEQMVVKIQPLSPRFSASSNYDYVLFNHDLFNVQSISSLNNIGVNHDDYISFNIINFSYNKIIKKHYSNYVSNCDKPIKTKIYYVQDNNIDIVSSEGDIFLDYESFFKDLIDLYEYKHLKFFIPNKTMIDLVVDSNLSNELLYTISELIDPEVTIEQEHNNSIYSNNPRYSIRINRPMQKLNINIRIDENGINFEE